MDGFLGDKMTVRTHRSITLNRTKQDDLEALNLKFKQHVVDLDLVKTEQNKDYDFEKRAGSNTNLVGTNLIFPDGSVKGTSNRFWISLAARAGINPSVFNLFNHTEVFERIKKKNIIPDGRFRVTEFENSGILLGISALDKPIIHYQNLMGVLKLHDSEAIRYEDGVISTIHKPATDIPMSISGEDYAPKILVDIPIDGYGQVNTYLGLMRLVCQNGIVAMAKSLKSQLNVGKDDNNPLDALVRMFNSFSNDEGYDALASRLNMAAKSVLSVEEFMKIYSILLKGLSISNTEKSPEAYKTADQIRARFQSMAGDLHSMYGITNLDALTSKQRSILQTKCRVYDAIQFISEFTTHILTRANNNDTRITKKFYSLIGDLLVNDFDFEGVYPDAMTPNKAFPDFYFSESSN